MSIALISDIRQIDKNKWQAFVNTHPNGTVFQSPEMYRLFDGAKNFDPVVIVAKENENIVGLLLAVIIREFSNPFGIFSSRTVVYGGPLIALDSGKDKNTILSEILEELIVLVKNRSVFIQFRNFSDKSDERKIFEDHGFTFLERLNYLVDTTSEAVVKSRMSASKMRQVRKGLNLGAEIISPERESQVQEFYAILKDLYKRKVRKPLPSYSFFKKFYLQSKKNELGTILLVKYKGKIIGGILSPVFTDQMIYEWYVCGLDQEYKHIYPSVLATWAAIDYALKNNIKAFDFMGVGLPDKDYGVREFKSKFGGELVNFGRFGRINNQFVYAITEVGFNILAILKKI